jgi:hypothetical protein
VVLLVTGVDGAVLLFITDEVGEGMYFFTEGGKAIEFNGNEELLEPFICGELTVLLLLLRTGDCVVPNFFFGDNLRVPLLAEGSGEEESTI